MVEAQAGLETNRLLTDVFIRMDPEFIVLIPIATHLEQPGGGHKKVAGPPRPAQTFKMIYPAGDSGGTVTTTDASLKKYDFILLGRHDAQVFIGDAWQDAKGNSWVVTGLAPYNGYEVKATCVAYGEDVSHGGD